MKARKRSRLEEAQAVHTSALSVRKSSSGRPFEEPPEQTRPATRP